MGLSRKRFMTQFNYDFLMTALLNGTLITKDGGRLSQDYRSFFRIDSNDYRKNLL